MLGLRSKVMRFLSEERSAWPFAIVVLTLGAVAIK